MIVVPKAIPIGTSGFANVFTGVMNGGITAMVKSQVYITQLDTGQKLQLAMPPESIDVKFAQNIRTFNIIHLGEVKLPRGEKLTDISWKGTLPGRKTAAYSFINSEAWREPKEIIRLFESWKNNHWERNTSKLRLLITETAINLDVYVDSFTHNYKGGQGDVEYGVSFSAAKDILVRTVEEIDGKTPERPAATSTPDTVTVKSGDCLWSIAQEKLGDGSRWPEIHELNKDQIKDPDLIYPGQTFKLPAK